MTPVTFEPPEYKELLWLVERKFDYLYVKYVLDVYEMPRSYSIDHGLPFGVLVDEERDTYEEGLCRKIEEFELPKERIEDLEYSSLMDKITSNTEVRNW